MANLSERLRANAEIIRRVTGGNPSPAWAEALGLLTEAATILDRLTVEGLAGVISKTVFTFPDMPESMKASRHIASRILDHLTTGTEEQGHG